MTMEEYMMERGRKYDGFQLTIRRSQRSSSGYQLETRKTKTIMWLRR